jgi:hypothetical protein
MKNSFRMLKSNLLKKLLKLYEAKTALKKYSNRPMKTRTTYNY